MLPPDTSGVQLSPDEVARFSRHLILPEVGMEGQKRLKAASVLCVGTGGLGSPLLLYLAAVFWTIGYDTIYALQDIEDDAVVGIRSSARTFGGHTRAAIAICYGLAAMLALTAIWLVGGGLAAYAGLALFAGHLARQLSGIGGATPQQALALFKSNRDAGLLLAAGLCIDPVLRGVF